MMFHAIIFVFTCFLSASYLQPVELIPVDAGVEDRGALSDSLRVVQTNMRQDSSFEKLYKVAGSDDIYVRKSGGLSAIFRSSQYIQTSKGNIPIVPAGTVYCIGEITPELIRQLGALQYPNQYVEIPETLVQPALAHVMHQPATPPKFNYSYSIEFLENEEYRRKRLTSFVIEIVLQNDLRR